MNKIRGNPPPSVPEPTADGYYWVRLATPRLVSGTGPMDQPYNGYSTWDRYDVELTIVHLCEGNVNWIGNDDWLSLQSSRRRLLEAIAIKEPA